MITNFNMTDMLIKGLDINHFYFYNYRVNLKLRKKLESFQSEIK